MLRVGAPVAGQDGRLASQRRQPRTGPRHVFLPDQPLHLRIARLAQLLLAERRRARQELVQQDPHRENVAPRVDVQAAHLRLLGAHVRRRADHLAVGGKERLFRQLLRGRLGHAEVDHLHNGQAVVQRDHHIGGFDVAVNDALVVRVLDGVTDIDEQFEPLRGRQTVLVAEFGDGHAFDQFHHEIGPAGVRRPRVEHLGDVRMVHQRQGLPLGLEAGDHLGGVHARLDDFQRHPAPHRLLLLGHVDNAEPALADLLQQFVGPNHGAGSLSDRGVISSGHSRRRPIEDAGRLVMGRQQTFNRGPQLAVATTVGGEICSPFRGGNLGGGKELVTNKFGIGRHDKSLRGLPYKAHTALEKSQESSGRSARAAVNHARA